MCVRKCAGATCVRDPMRQRAMSQESESQGNGPSAIRKPLVSTISRTSFPTAVTRSNTTISPRPAPAQMNMRTPEKQIVPTNFRKLRFNFPPFIGDITITKLIHKVRLGYANF